MLGAIVHEAELRRTGWATWYAPKNGITSLYLGGGTPSLLEPQALQELLRGILDHYPLAIGAEVTLEANPDDATPERIAAWRDSPINRLSLGIQSFRDTDLVWMNRAHTAAEARLVLDRTANAGFQRSTADLIYGIPGLDDQAWLANIRELVARGMPHISAYALTVEPRTVLAHRVKTGHDTAPDPDAAERQFRLLAETLDQAGYAHYEVSNWCLPGAAAVHNTSYWCGAPYLGLGPSAHGYDGASHRYANVANNAGYIRAVAAAKNAVDPALLPTQADPLSLADRLNERIMTGLRTSWGLPKQAVAGFGPQAIEAVSQAAVPWLEHGGLCRDDAGWWLSAEGRFLADGIAADLFVDGDAWSLSTPDPGPWKAGKAHWGRSPFLDD